MWVLFQGVLVMLLGVAVAAAIFFGIRWWREDKERGKTPSYRRRSSLLSSDEKSVYKMLVKVMGKHAHVFVKVRLADLIFLPDDTINLGHQRARVGRRYVDFVLCSPSSLAPVLAINLEGDSAEISAAAEQSKRLIEDAVRIAGLPMLRIGVDEAADASKLSRSIRLSIAANSQDWKSRSVDGQTEVVAAGFVESISSLDGLRGQLQRWFPDLKRESRAG
jgi:hypothetical protein